MKISETIRLLTTLKTMYGDLEVLTNDSYAISSLCTETVSASQAEEWDMIEGERYVRIVDDN